jgi:hypothetical protein
MVAALRQMVVIMTARTAAGTATGAASVRRRRSSGHSGAAYLFPIAQRRVPQGLLLCGLASRDMACIWTATVMASDANESDAVTARRAFLRVLCS